MIFVQFRIIDFLGNTEVRGNDCLLGCSRDACGCGGIRSENWEGRVLGCFLTDHPDPDTLPTHNSSYNRRTPDNKQNPRVLAADKHNNGDNPIPPPASIPGVVHGPVPWAQQLPGRHHPQPQAHLPGRLVLPDLLDRAPAPVFPVWVSRS